MRLSPTSEQEPAILGTLSAVYAEMGQFDKAIELGSAPRIWPPSKTRLFWRKT